MSPGLRYLLPSGHTVEVVLFVHGSHVTCHYLNGYGNEAQGVGEVTLTPLFLARWGQIVRRRA